MKAFQSLVVAGVLILFALTSEANDPKVKYPDDYRKWTHIKTMLIEPGHPLENPFQGLHHVYGNWKAVQGLKEGSFPDGSILVFDLVEYNKSDHTIQEGERKLVGVMEKNQSDFPSTGGWGFEAFSKNSKLQRIVSDRGKSCFSCHNSQKEHDFVFSKLRN